MGTPIAVICLACRPVVVQSVMLGRPSVNDQPNHLEAQAPEPMLSPRIYHQLFEHYPHAVLVADPRGRLLSANPAAQWIARSDSVAELGVNGGLASASSGQAFRAALLGGSDWSGPLTLAATDGTARAVTAQVRHAPECEGEAASVLCIFQPATAAQTGSEADLDFRSTVDSAPVMIWMARPDGLYDWFNQPWLVFTGLRMDELRGNGWLDAVHPEDQERCVGIYKTSFSEQQPFVMDYRLRRHDGQYRWILDNGIPRYAADGSFEGYIGSCVEIHERKELEERLANHTRTLRLADRRQNEFLAMLSHELRSPLAPIANAASVLRTLEAENPTLVRLREIIERQVGRLRQLVDDLIDVTRVMQGQITLVKERLSAQDLVRSAVETSHTKLEAAGHTLRLDLPKNPIWVQGDAVRLAQALSNLLANAAKFTPQPSVISVSAKTLSGSLKIAVRDEGQGISADFLPHVFDLFSQQDQPLARNAGGLGLGLPLAKRVAQLHGGDLKAFSDGAGRGAEFILSLPLAGHHDTTEHGTQLTGFKPTSSYRVLIIEDNPDTAYLLRLQIELWGNQVATAGNADEAVRLAEAFKPQIVLCDIGLPDQDGYQLIPELRQRLLGSSTLFAALTGYGRQEDEARARACGFEAFLVKPLRPDSLGKLFESYASRIH